MSGRWRGPHAVVMFVVAATCMALAPAAQAANYNGQIFQLTGTAGCVSQGVDASCADDARGLNGLTQIIVSPDGLNAYSVSNNGSAIAIFDRNAMTGALTQKAGTAGCITVSTGDVSCTTTGRAIENTAGIAISPDGANVYATGQTGNGIAIFDRDATTGVLTQKSGSDGCITQGGSDATCDQTGRALSDAYGVTVSPDGENVYVASLISDAIAIFDRDTSNGKLTQQAGAAGCITANAIATCDQTGRGMGDPWGVIVSPDGDNVYMSASGSNALVVFDRAAGGGLTQKAGTAGCISSSAVATCDQTGRNMSFVRDLTISPDGNNIYVASQGNTGVDGGVVIFDRAGDGTISQKAGAAGCITSQFGNATCNQDGRATSGTMSVAVSPDGQSLYTAAQSAAGIAVFDRSAGGSLTQKAGTAGCITADSDPSCTDDARGVNYAYSVAISPDGADVYLASFNKAIAAFDRDEAPTCQSITEVGAELGKPVSIPLKCTDADGDTLSYAIGSAPKHGSVAIEQGPGVAVYTAQSGAGETDSFQFVAIARGIPSTPPTEVKLRIAANPALAISKLAISPSTFRAASSGPTASVKRPIGATVSWQQNVAGSVSFTVEQQVKGRKSGKKCSTKRKRGKRCTTIKQVGSAFSRQGNAGRNSFIFSGRVNGRKLKPGSYRLVAATKTVGTAATKLTANFKVVK